MRAATVKDGEIVIQEHPDPEPGAGECLIEVKGAGMNGADILQRAGHYPAPPGRSRRRRTSLASWRSTSFPPSSRER